MASVRAARVAGKPSQKQRNPSSTSSPIVPSSSASRHGAPGEEGGSNVNRSLYKDLVDMFPLVESLMDRKPNPSFRRRASMVYTPTPFQPKEAADVNGKIKSQTHSAKQSDHRENSPNKELGELDVGSDFSVLSSSTPTADDVQKNDKELNVLQDQFDDLHKRLLEKDEALKTLNDTLKEMDGASVILNGLKQQLMEKDSLITNANLQLSSTKIKLEERQASLDKLALEVKESNSKIQELQGVLDSTNFEMSAFMKLFDELSKTYSDPSSYDNNTPQPLEQLHYMVDDIDEIDSQKMEEARIAYVAAVTAAKENPCEESLAAATEARLHLQSFLLNCC